MTKLLIDARAGISNAVDGWTKIRLYGKSLLDNHREPHETKTKRVAGKHPANKLVILNLEHWPLPEQAEKYIQLVDWWRKVRPELRIGYYRLLPKREYWAPLLKDLERLQAWHNSNQELGQVRRVDGTIDPRGLADTVDFLCPSLYTFYPASFGAFRGRTHEQLWFEEYAPQNIEAARRFQKAIYPFIWPRYHKDRRIPLSAGFLERQIAWCLKHTDGCVIWDSVGHVSNKAVQVVVDGVMRKFV